MMKSVSRIIIIKIWCTLVLLFPIASRAQAVYTDIFLQNQLYNAQRDVCEERFGDAVEKYASLVKAKDHKTVRAEYAYALALTGCYDGAVVNLDKIIANGQTDKEVLFYMSQVLRLMEYDTVANYFAKESYTPKWISGHYLLYGWKYRYGRASINTDGFSTALQRANRLADQQQYMQSMVLFLELIETYPDQYLPCIGLSALFENLGFSNLAIFYLGKGIERMKDDYGGKKNPKDVYKAHLDMLEKKQKKETGKGLLLKQDGKLGKGRKSGRKNENIKSFSHIGMTYYGKSLGCNTSYGFYTGATTNVTFNYGWTIDLESAFASHVLDFSYNFEMGKNFLLGGTLTQKLNLGEKASYNLGLGLRGGYSLPLSKGKSSIDILLGWNIYLVNIVETNATLSIGYTRYF